MIASVLLATLSILAMAALAIGLVWIPRGLVAAVGRPPSLRTTGVHAAFVLLTELLAYLGLRLIGNDLHVGVEIALVTLAAVLGSVMVLDIAYYIIPDIYVVAIVGLAFLGPLAQAPSLALGGAALCGSLLGGLRWIWKRFADEEGLGFGDVKLAAALGALLGPIDALTVVAVASGLAAVTHLLAHRRVGRAPDAQPQWMPLGAFLAATSLARVAWAVR